MKQNLLPQFYLIGAARSGTTSIYHSISDHPDVFMPVKKEPNFFSINWEKGIEWYQSLFSGYSGEKIIGEASVTYSFPQYPEAPKRISQIIPDARFIYILRNPVQRTYSHYLYYRYYGLETWESFEQAIQLAPDCLGASQYYQRIEEYLKYFHRNQLLVMLFEDYVAKPVDFMKTIYKFLEIDDSFGSTSTGVKTNASFKSRNELIYKIYRRFSLSKMRLWIESFLPHSLRPFIRNRVHSILGSQQGLPQLSQRDRLYLEEFFCPDVENLGSFIERDLTEVWDLSC